MNVDKAFSLYEVLEKCKSNALETEAISKYIKIKLALKKFVEDINEKRALIAEETKCEDEEEWNSKFQKVFLEYVKSPVEIETKVFSIEEVATLISKSDLSGAEESLVIGCFVSNIETHIEDVESEEVQPAQGIEGPPLP